MDRDSLLTPMLESAVKVANANLQDKAAAQLQFKVTSEKDRVGGITRSLWIQVTDQWLMDTRILVASTEPGGLRTSSPVLPKTPLSRQQSSQIQLLMAKAHAASVLRQQIALEA